MTTVVPTSEEDPCLTVGRFTSELARADAGPEECMVRGRWFELVSLMLTSADLIFSKVAEKDLKWIFAVICNVVLSSSGETHLRQYRPATR
ncbi:hypothetical protein MLD38_001283 [Melastoma candidum]|uniref:Uncharacterized protein n=1 Tax=Melastoma candidum TaxID=119954 RepID=A0ACB9SGP6_9MYRT|nr:hypothetical protein MLD38_001283 [Melastoma candidum]